MIILTGMLFLAAVGVLTLGIQTAVKREGSDLERRNSYVQSFGLAFALAAAGIQFVQQSRMESQQSNDAITRILLTAYDPGDVDTAFGALNAVQSIANLNDAARTKFRSETGTLTSYFWAVNTCVRSKVCDVSSSQRAFCDDYLRYRDTFERVNGREQADATFRDMEAMEKCRKA